MRQNAHDAYLESRILSAGPVEMVCLLYQSAMKAVRQARHLLATGDIAARASSISMACEILIELTSSLDYARGGEISLHAALGKDPQSRRHRGRHRLLPRHRATGLSAPGAARAQIFGEVGCISYEAMWKYL